VKEGEIGMRYAMLETVRQYAQERLVESGEADELRDRHLKYFADQAEAASLAIMELRVGDWIERLAGDVDNQRAARAWALENDIDAAFRMVSGLSARIMHIYPPMEMLQYQESIIARAETLNYHDEATASPEQRRMYGAGLAAASDLSLILGMGETAYDYATRAIDITRETDNMPSHLMALLMAAVTSSFSGRLKEAAAYNEQITSLTSTMPPNWFKALSLISFSTVLRFPNPDGVELSWKNWEEGMAMLRQGGDLWGLGFGHAMASGAAFVFKDPDKACFHAQRSLEIFGDYGDAYTANIPRSRLADLARQRGDLEEATALYKQVIAGWRDATQFGAMARCVECLAFVGRAKAQDPGSDSQTGWLSFAATLLGAAATLRTDHKAAMTFLEQAEFDDEVEKLKSLAGEEPFQQNWQRGQRMDPDQIVVFSQSR
jgi:tetratricopeptide (TPR) repeat protein